MITLTLALAPLFIGFLAPLWFGRLLPPVRKLRRGAKWVDLSIVNVPPSSSLTVQALREHDQCGDRIVIAHHLADWTIDLQRKIFQAMGTNTVMAFVVIIVFITKNNEALLLQPAAGFDDWFQILVANWPFSILLALSLIEIIVVIKVVSDVAAKYRKVIEAARPEWVPLAQRMRAFGKRVISRVF